MKTIIYFLVVAALVWLVANYWGSSIGVSLENSYSSALIFSIVLAVVNAVLWTLLRVLWMPLNVLTLWLFSFVVTLIVIWVTDKLYNWIEISWIVAYLVIAIIPALASFIVWPTLIKK